MYRYFRKRAEELLRSLEVKPEDPDKVIEEIRKIRRELWQRGKQRP